LFISHISISDTPFYFHLIFHSKVGGVTQKTTGLQIEINRFVFIIASFSVTTAIICILVWVLYLNTQHYGFMTSSSMIANAISVWVAFIPEGLPLSLSMGLTLIARRLGTVYHVMIKQLSIVETAGSMSLLASDKTGTLTQNKMTVRRIIVPSAILSADGCIPVELDAGSIDVLLATCAHCNQAKLETPLDGSGSKTAVAVGGNGIDQALLNWAATAAPSLLDKVYRECTVNVMMPFSSKAKLAAVVVQRSDGRLVVANKEDDEANAAATSISRVIVKGAPEFVLARCASYIDTSGAVAPLTVVQMVDVNRKVDLVSDEGQRVIAIAYADLPADRFPEDFGYVAEPEPNFPLFGLTFLSCIAVSDPPRMGVREAVDIMRGAGIMVSMVTGDATKTAVAIAKQVGIVSEEDNPDSLAKYLDALRRVGADDALGSMPKPGFFVAPGAGTAAVAASGSAAVLSQGEGKEAEALDLESRVVLLRSLSSSTGVIGRSKRSNAVVIEGRDLDSITKAGWDFVFAHTEMVFARTTPEHKLMVSVNHSL
jgi:sodium/potassium-transporting ATPase subunit alpha